jgi:hypothetical protein
MARADNRHWIDWPEWWRRFAQWRAERLALEDILSRQGNRLLRDAGLTREDAAAGMGIWPGLRPAFFSQFSYSRPTAPQRREEGAATMRVRSMAVVVSRE